MTPDLSISDVARRLGASRDTVKSLLRAGSLTGAYRLGARGHWRIPAGNVEQFVRRQQEAASPPRVRPPENDVDRMWRIRNELRAANKNIRKSYRIVTPKTH